AGKLSRVPHRARDAHAATEVDGGAEHLDPLLRSGSMKDVDWRALECDGPLALDGAAIEDRRVVVAPQQLALAGDLHADQLILGAEKPRLRRRLTRVGGPGHRHEVDSEARRRFELRRQRVAHYAWGFLF